MEPYAKTGYCRPTWAEITAKARRNWLLNRNTRWHGQKGARP